MKMKVGIFPIRLNFDPPLGFVWQLLLKLSNGGTRTNSRKEL
jgi:hypothetical protein